MRVPFEEAISDDQLLGAAWDTLSWPQRVVLKAFYGLPLRTNVINPETGRSELDYWAILQGSCDYDELGYPTTVRPIPYTPKEYDQLWAVLGRRGGKTTKIMSLLVAYEALLGGHEDYVGPKQDCVIYLIAQRLDLAIANLTHVRAIVESSPLLAGEVAGTPKIDRLSFNNGIHIAPSSPSLRAQRGFAVPVAAMDEVAFWYSDREAANPDFEVERAVSYSQLQFPHSKRVGISTPWTKEGLLYQYHTAGTEGCLLPASVDKTEYQGILTVFAPTAACENSLITRKKLEAQRRRDPDAFERESLCKYLDSVSGFLNHALLEAACTVATDQKLAQRPPVNAEKTGIQPTYVAAIDPAFRHDSFAFTVVHKGTEGVVQDYVKRWTPLRGQKLNPAVILAEMKPILAHYDVAVVYTDQYQFESLQQLALGQDINIEAVDFTGRSKAKIFGSLQQLVNQRKLQLLDPFTNEDAKEQLHELRVVERRLTPNGGVQISAPEGKHDDLVAVLALAAHKAIWQDPVVTAEDEGEAEKPPTLFERGMATIRKRNLQNAHPWNSD